MDDANHTAIFYLIPVWQLLTIKIKIPNFHQSDRKNGWKPPS
ncbi:MAG: hypothetical protein P2A85_14950 [Microcoleus anatoxicus]